MRGRGLIVAVFQGLAAQRGLNERVVGLGLLQTIENFKIRRDILRVFSAPARRKPPTESATAAERLPDQEPG